MISLRTWARQLAAGGVLRYGYLLAGTKIPQTTKVNCDIAYGNLPLWGSRKKIWRRLQMDLNSRASRKKLMVQLRCHARAYKGIAAASVTFCGKEERRRVWNDDLWKEKSSRTIHSPRRRGADNRNRTCMRVTSLEPESSASASSAISAI